MSDDHIAITGLALLSIWTAAAYTRRHFRTLPSYATTPLAPQPRPVSWPCGAKSDGIGFLCTLGDGHGGEHVAQGHGEREIHRWSSFDQHADEAMRLCDPDPIGRIYDEWAAELNDPTAVARWMEGAS